MKVSFRALHAAAAALRLEADVTRRPLRRDMLDEVASALLSVANGGGVIELAEDFVEDSKPAQIWQGKCNAGGTYE